MRRDPEEQIIAAALDEAELDDGNERGVGAQIEFRREGHAKVDRPPVGPKVCGGEPARSPA